MDTISIIQISDYLDNGLDYSLIFNRTDGYEK